MRPATASNTTTGAGFWHWSSPMPYLFGGLALMLGVITVALIILACSYRKSLSNREGEEKSVKKVEIGVVDSEPKIVVIMAGDENPTYLAMAKPIPEIMQEQVLDSCNCQNQEPV